MSNGLLRESEALILAIQCHGIWRILPIPQRCEFDGNALQSASDPNDQRTRDRRYNMAEIIEYLNEVWGQFSSSQEAVRDRFRLDLQRSDVDGLVRAAFYGSMIPDEGRFPEVCLMCYRADDTREYHVPFQDPYEATAQNIAKLAHGVSRKGHIYCLCNKSGLKLSGYNVTFLNEHRHFGYGLERAGNPLKVTIRGPGLIEVSTGGGAIIYRAGAIVEEEPLQYADAMRELSKCVANEFAGCTTGVIESLEAIFNDMSKAVVRLGHGGMLIFMKDIDWSQFSSRRETNCPMLRDLLIRYWDDVKDEHKASEAAMHATMGGPRGSFCWNIEMIKVASDVTMLENAIASIGNLAGLDGAIVLDYGCRVAAFNAIINKDAAGAKPAQLVDRIGRHLTPEEVGETRGSRHQSAMSFAMRVPKSFVFVISQDGGVSGFYNRGDGTVLCEQGLRVLE